LDAALAPFGTLFFDLEFAGMFATNALQLLACTEISDCARSRLPQKVSTPSYPVVYQRPKLQGLTPVARVCVAFRERGIVATLRAVM
jgi:hypothetical protein